MGQAEHRQNLRQSNSGERSQGQALRRLCATLVGCALVALALPQNSSEVKVPAFDKQASWQYLLKQCDFGPRVPETPAANACREYLLKELGKYTDNVRVKPFTHNWSVTGKPVTMYNIIGDQNWEKSTVHVVLMAHWDSRPFASEERDVDKAKEPILGADDGASGVAVLLELAKELRTEHPEVGIEYVLDDGEDLGPGIEEMLLGAADYAKTLPAKKPDYGILLDMIGNKGVSVPIEPNSYAAAKPLVHNFYLLAGKLGLSSTFPNSFGPEIEDDHLPLIAAGVPTMDLIDFNYPAWHTLRDKPDQCSPDALGNIGTMLKAWLLQKPAFQMKAN